MAEVEELQWVGKVRKATSAAVDILDGKYHRFCATGRGRVSERRNRSLSRARDFSRQIEIVPCLPLSAPASLPLISTVETKAMANDNV